MLAPHTDDAELGCGATLARLLQAGASVHVAVFSTAEASLPEGAPPGELRRECIAALNVLGVGAHNVTIYDYPVRRFPEHRQEILEQMIGLKRAVRPRTVLFPAGSDVHQDHCVVHAEGVRAFKDVTLWGYELPWNHVSFSATGFVVVGSQHLERKWEALQAYKTQFSLARPYFSREFIYGLAAVRGAQVRARYAEAFEAVRTIFACGGVSD